MMLMLHVLG